MQKTFIKKIFPEKLKVLFVASEVFPFAKAGGLGDVIYSLSLSLNKLGHDVRVMIPFYGTIDREKYKTSTEIAKLEVPTDQAGDYPFLVCAVKKHQNTYFLENMEYYEQRANVYGYADDHIRWILLCRGALEFLKKSTWKPDVIVAADWQTGLIPNYIKTRYGNEFSKTAVVFAIHNLQYQGMCDFRFMPETERDSGSEPIPDFFNPRLAKLNWLLRGVLYSQRIVTVSPAYAEEILTPEFGEGLHKVFEEKRDKIDGILNGIAQEDHNPETSPHIFKKYSFKKLSGKKENKRKLQERFGLPQDEKAFLISMVTRLVQQKGFDLLEQIGENIFKNLNIQLIVAGDGESRYKEMIDGFSKKFPDKVKYHLQFDDKLPHQIFAGSDGLLMPSKFEPCGVTQMQAMKYGCLPIARKTGGLASTIKDCNCTAGTGFLFEAYEPTALYTALVRAHTVFQFKDIWQKMLERAMKKDFSWTHSAKRYLEVFNQAIKDVLG